VKKLLIGECHENNIFNLVDPTGFLEIEFEAEVVESLQEHSFSRVSEDLLI
jgi:hypothetical protein